MNMTYFDINAWYDYYDSHLLRDAYLLEQSEYIKKLKEEYKEDYISFLDSFEFKVKNNSLELITLFLVIENPEQPYYNLTSFMYAVQLFLLAYGVSHTLIICKDKDLCSCTIETENGYKITRGNNKAETEIINKHYFPLSGE